MQKLSGVLVAQMVKLRVKGLSHKVIAKKLFVSTGSAYNHTKGLNLSLEAKNRLLFSEHENRLKFASKYAKEKQINKPGLSQELAFVLGHLFFDGSVSHSKGKYMLSYCNASIELVNEFISKVGELFSLKAGKISKVNGVNVDWYQVAFYSKKAFRFIKSFSSSFSTNEQIGVPRKILGADEKTKCAFLQAFWADEGCIDYKGRLIGSSKSGRMIEDLIKIHSLLGIKCKKQSSKKGFHFIVIIKEPDNYRLFSQKVGFGKAIVKAGYNVGKYKQHVLLAALARMANI